MGVVTVHFSASGQVGEAASTPSFSMDTMRTPSNLKLHYGSVRRLHVVQQLPHGQSILPSNLLAECMARTTVPLTDEVHV